MHAPLHVSLPTGDDDGSDDLAQNHEWCTVHLDGITERVRFHDYERIYSIPGLYEHLFEELLECCSPETVCGLLARELDRNDVDPGSLNVLDFGAGNGMVGERLAAMGVGAMVGVDILDEAAAAAERDRPGLYDDYLVSDFNELEDEDREDLGERGFNVLTTVAALGFGDIPPRAFAEAFNLVAPDGWLAFNIKPGFLERGETTGFGGLVRHMIDAGAIQVSAQTKYQHRLAANGDPLPYVALVARKRRDIADAEIPEY